MSVHGDRYVYTYTFNTLAIDVSVLVPGQGPHTVKEVGGVFRFTFLKLDVHVFSQEAQSRESLLFSSSLVCMSS